MFSLTNGPVIPPTIFAENCLEKGSSCVQLFSKRAKSQRKCTEYALKNGRFLAFKTLAASFALPIDIHVLID